MQNKQLTLWPPTPGKTYRLKTYKVTDPYCPTEVQTLGAVSLFTNTMLPPDHILLISRIRVGHDVNLWGTNFTRIT
jgi:hypothetical protein